MQVATDARDVAHDIDVEIGQLVGRADPGAQEQRGGVDRAGADDDLAPRQQILELPRRTY